MLRFAWSDWLTIFGNKLEPIFLFISCLEYFVIFLICFEMNLWSTANLKQTSINSPHINSIYKFPKELICQNFASSSQNFSSSTCRLRVRPKHLSWVRLHATSVSTRSFRSINFLDYICVDVVLIDILLGIKPVLYIWYCSCKHYCNKTRNKY